MYLKNATIRSLGIFQHLNFEEITRVLSTAAEKSIRPGEVVFEEGKRDPRLIVLLEGELELQKGKKTWTKVGPGTHFGEVSIVADSVRESRAIAAGPGTILVFEQEVFYRLLREDTCLAVKCMWSLLGSLGNRVQVTMDAVKQADPELLDKLCNRVAGGFGSDPANERSETLAAGRFAGLGRGHGATTSASSTPPGEDEMNEYVCESPFGFGLDSARGSCVKPQPTERETRRPLRKKAGSRVREGFDAPECRNSPDRIRRGPLLMAPSRVERQECRFVVEGDLPREARIEFEATALSDVRDLKVEVFRTRREHAGYVVIFGGWRDRVSVLARLDEHGKDRIENRSFVPTPNQKHVFLTSDWAMSSRFLWTVRLCIAWTIRTRLREGRSDLRTGRLPYSLIICVFRSGRVPNK